MTEKLYDQDAYAVEFDAKVISCEAYQEIARSQLSEAELKGGSAS